MIKVNGVQGSGFRVLIGGKYIDLQHIPIRVIFFQKNIFFSCQTGFECVYLRTEKTHINYTAMIAATPNEIILYQPDSTIQLEVRIENETVWLNRQQIAQLFDRDIKTLASI